MAEQFYTILTNVGKAKIANALPTGQKVNFKKMKVGDSNGTYYNPSEEQNDLINKVYECDITSVEVDENNPNWVTITSAIPSDVGGFSIREVGVFDDTNSLIAIGKYPETYKPTSIDGSTKELYIKMTLEVTNAASVDLKIDPTVILATKKDIAKIDIKIDDINSKLDKITPDTTMYFLKGINKIKEKTIINTQGFYNIEEESSGKYIVKKIVGDEKWSVIKYKDFSFKISELGDIAENKELTKNDNKLSYIQDKSEYNINCFGAIPNANYYNDKDFKFYEDSGFSIESIDNSIIVQSVVNRIIKNNGGIFNFQQGRYKISNTIYINPSKTRTITIKGVAPIKSGNETMYTNNTIVHGSRILCDANIIFSVNRDEKGVQVDGIKSAQFEGFVSENIAFDGVKIGEENSGIDGFEKQPTFKDSTCYYILGTRFIIKNCSCYGLSKFIYQPENDSKGNINYSDFVNVENIYCRYISNSILTLSRCDVSTIKSIYSEKTKMGAEHLISVYNAQQVNISGVSDSMHTPQSSAPDSKNSAIKLLLVNGANVSNVYSEANYIFDSIVYAYNSYSVYVNNVSDQGMSEEYSTYPILKLRNSNVWCTGVHSRSIRKTGCGDFNITTENSGKSKLILEDYDIRDFKTDKLFNELEPRHPLINGTENLSVLKLKDLKMVKIITNSDKTISIKDYNGKDLSGVFGIPTWDGTGIVLKDRISANSISFLNYLFYIEVYPIPILATKVNSMSHQVAETNRSNGFLKFCFFDSNGNRITTQDDMMNFGLICS